MSEQKMPALPLHDGHFDAEYRIRGWERHTVERIQREAYEACRQQERERLEPLMEALGKLSAEWRVPIPPEKESCEYGIDSTIELTREECADALDALIAKHKENTR